MCQDLDAPRFAKSAGAPQEMPLGCRSNQKSLNLGFSKLTGNALAVAVQFVIWLAYILLFHVEFYGRWKSAGRCLLLS